MRRTGIYCALLLLIIHHQMRAQERASAETPVRELPAKIFKSINDKATSMNERLPGQTVRYMARIRREEKKLQRKMWAKDSSMAKELFKGVDEQYKQLATQMGTISKVRSVYSGHLDSVTTALHFLTNIDVKQNSPELNEALKSLQNVQQQFNASQQVNKYLLQRQQLLKESFKKFGMAKELNKYRQQCYYYQEQVKEYKNMFEKPDQPEKKLLEWVKQLPAFKDFFAKNSLLSSLFAMPASTGGTASIAPGLQTREMVNQAMINRFGSMELVNQRLQANTPAAQSQLQQLKNQLKGTTSGSMGNGDSDMPDFAKNDQRTKPFFDRLELGMNVQSQKATRFFPVTSDIALSAGYKWRDNLVTGVGLSYKIGWGSGWNHLQLSGQGEGIRFYTDLKLKGSFWLTGGYELNYRPSLDTMLDNHGNGVTTWQKSGLVGLSKIVSLQSKLFKKTKVQLLWDFLSYSQRPRTPAFIWRVGYSFK